LLLVTSVAVASKCEAELKGLLFHKSDFWFSVCFRCRHSPGFGVEMKIFCIRHLTVRASTTSWARLESDTRHANVLGALTQQHRCGNLGIRGEVLK
jgi:hypothetical protein